MKNVQIPQELFMKLLRYHLLNDDTLACAAGVAAMKYYKEHDSGEISPPIPFKV